MSPRDPDTESASGGWPREPGFDDESGLLRPWLTKWYLHRTFSASKRGNDNAYVLVDFSLDKPANTSYAPDPHTELYTFVGDQLRAMLRSADSAGHLLSPEFIFFLPSEKLEGAETVADRIVEELDGTPLPSRRTVRVRAVPFVYTPDVETPEDLIERARQRLSKRKAGTAPEHKVDLNLRG